MLQLKHIQNNENNIFLILKLGFIVFSQIIGIQNKLPITES